MLAPEYTLLQIKNRLVSIPISNVLPNPAQPREHFDQASIEELAQSIANYGLLQPIVVRMVGSTFELVSGERRLRACKMLNLPKIDAIISDVNSEQSAFLALIENVQREDLDFFEQAISMATLINNYSITQHELAHRMGVSQSSVANKLRLLRLPIEIRKCIVQSKLTERHARALLKLNSEEQLYAAVEKIVYSKLSVSQTELLVDSMLSTKKPLPCIKLKFTDYRIYTNTIKKAMKELNKAGVTFQMNSQELPDKLVYTITIDK